VEFVAYPQVLGWFYRSDAEVEGSVFLAYQGSVVSPAEALPAPAAARAVRVAPAARVAPVDLADQVVPVDPAALADLRLVCLAALQLVDLAVPVRAVLQKVQQADREAERLTRTIPGTMAAIPTARTPALCTQPSIRRWVLSSASRATSPGLCPTRRWMMRTPMPPATTIRISLSPVPSIANPAGDNGLFTR